MEALPPEAVRHNLDIVIVIVWTCYVAPPWSCFINYLNVSHLCLWVFFISAQLSSELKFHNKYSCNTCIPTVSNNHVYEICFYSSTDIQLLSSGISGEKVEIDPVTSQKASTKFWIRQKPISIDSDHLCACDLVEERSPSEWTSDLIFSSLHDIIL